MTEKQPGFWKRNGKKFIVQLAVVASLVWLTLEGHIDGNTVAIILAAIAGVNAGAVTR